MKMNFNPEMLILARESRGQRQSELARIMSLYQGTISKIEAGLLQPNEAMLFKFADALDYPPEFFFQQDRVYGFNSSVFFHRKRQNLPDRILRSLHAKINIRRIQLERLLRSAEVDTKNQFERLELADYRFRVENIAQIVRASWLLPPGPVRNVIGAIEDAGGFVFEWDFGTRKVDAISEWISGYPPMFFVNSTSEITGDRLRLTLAHEIGHVVMHKFQSPSMEEEANKFAGEFLMPAREIKASLYNLSIPKLAQLKAHWKVSMQALVERAHHLGTITPSQRKYLYMQFSRFGYRLREPIETDIPREKPTMLRELVDTHVKELGYSVYELGALMAMNETEVRELYIK
jgi:Zn-dependent peptidase ImmA (M78 family)/DNA-binding XRE family transcriptional regulator